MKAGRASIGYAERLKAILEFFDPSAVSIFFLEWDVQRFRDWVSNLTTPEIAAGLPLKSDVPNQVIRRRKLPNYVNTGNALIAFGSRKGELVEYKNVPEKRLLRIMRTRRKWTLNLSSEEIRQGTQEFFGKDLEECAALTGSENFLRYLNDEFPAERAEFSHPRSLERLHQWTGPAPDTPSTVAATALKTAVPSRKVAVLSRSFSEHETLRGELLARFPGTQFNETGRTLAGDELVEFLQGRDAIVVALEKIDAALLARLPDLRIISKYGVGLDNVDLEACAKVGVRVGWTGGVNRQSVAELTVAFAIDGLRHVMQSHTEIQTGTFRQIRGRNLQGNTVGLIGCGHVGQRVARLFQAFGCTVLAHDIRSFPEFYKETGVEPVSFDDLLARADIVSLHVPLTPATRNMIGEAALARMKHDAVLINTARGGLVDEEALKAALKAKKLYGAAFDVFSPEPPQDTELLALPNFIATGHIGGSTAQSVLAMGRAAIDGLESAIDALDHIPDYLR
jgi:D-3-phosphoglycerate dehydrogenase